MNLSAYPTLTTDFQTVVENYPTLEPTLEGKKNHEFNEFSAVASGYCG